MEGQKVLESWKEIAAYLKRSVATCQRWEIELKLPVHRLDGTPKARVFAYPEEIDRWMAEKLRSSVAALRASEELPSHKNKKLMVVAATLLVFAAVAVLAWRLLLRKPVPHQPLVRPSLPGKIESELNQDKGIDLGPITSRSPDAFQCYIEGCEIMRSIGGGDFAYRKARAQFNKATEIDPAFAMAYSALASTYGSKEEQTKYLKKALELSDAVSLRERLMIQGDYHSTVENNYEKAIQAYKKALKIYPDDDMANDSIASLYARIRDPKNAFKHREYLYKKNKSSRNEFSKYVGSCIILGYYEKCIEAYEHYLNNAPHDFEMWREVYDWYWQSGKYDLALKVAERLREAGADQDVERIFPLYLMGDYSAAEQLCKDYARHSGSQSVWKARDWLQNIYITQGQFEKAKQQVVLGLQEEEELAKSGQVKDCAGRVCLRMRLAGLYMIEGRWQDALDEAEKAWAVATEFKRKADQFHASMIKAEIYIELNRIDKAKEIADVACRPLKDSRYMMGDYYFVAGHIELHKGNLKKSIDFLEKAQASTQSSYNSQPYKMNPKFTAALASAYCQAGNPRSARKECEQIPLSIEGRLFQGYTYAMNFYVLGSICEQLGQRVEAKENYNKFLALWKDADPIFPQVEDARAGLARLSSR